MRSILFVCTANICRSPMAEGALRKLLEAEGIAREHEIDSAGTHDYQAGKAPFELAVRSAALRGYKVDHLVARRVRPADFDHFDMILAMDRHNLRNLQTIAPTRCKNKIELLLNYGERFFGEEIADPYGGEAKAFELALDMIEDGCRGLAQLLAQRSARRTAS